MRRARILSLVVLLATCVAGRSHAQVAERVPVAVRGQPFDLSIANIMRGPEHVGVAPSDLRWSPDGAWLYFRWRQGGGAWDDEEELHRVRADGTGLELVPDAQRDSVAVLLARGDETADRARRIVSVEGDLYLVHAAGSVRRLTRTRVTEREPRFTSDGASVLYREGDDVYLHRLSDGATRQLTDIRQGSPPVDEADAEGQEKFLEDQQLELFEDIRREAARADSAEVRGERSRDTLPEPLYVPTDERVADLDPSPDGRFVLVDLRPQGDEDGATSVPEWITGSGYTSTRSARRKVGMDPGATRLGLLDVASGDVRWLDPRPAGYEVEVRARSHGWNDAGTHALVSARSDDDEDWFLYALDSRSGELTLLDHEHDDAWIGGPCRGCVGWMPDGRTAWFVNESTGWAHLNSVKSDGSGKRPLTSGAWEVLDVELTAPPDRPVRFLLTTNEGSPFDRRLAWLDPDGGGRSYLSEEPGAFDGVPSPAGDRLAVLHSVANRPPELYLAPADDLGGWKRVTRSPTEEWLTFPWLVPEIVRFPADDDVPVPARVYRPADLGAEPNGAGVIFVHGAGYLHNVHNYWSSYYREYMFHHYLAASGYTVLDIDYRGSAGYGRDWRTAIYRHMGGRDLGDQVDGARWLVEHEGIDAARIGIYGGSYGGFITLMALFNAGDTFRAGAALRSVTDWAHYNDGYTSNILNDPQEDPEAYRRSSPIYFAEGLQPGRSLLMLHGMEDTNVHFSDVVRLAQRLIELGKEDWELAVYPTEGHAFEAPSSWTDEYRRIFELFDRTIGR